MFFLSFLLLLLPLVSSASRHSSRMRRMHARFDDTVITGQWSSVQTGPYSLSNDLWNENNALTGSQTSQLTSSSGSGIGWTTSYTWTGGYQVKSFANVQLNTGINQQLSAISSMNTSWQWSQSSDDVMADVAYDLFTSWSSGGSNANEIMIWLANINSGPISYNYDAEGNAVPIATGISLENYTWNLYSGFNGVNQVYSFLLPKGSGNINSFSGDVYSFLSYLIDNEGISSSQYLTCAQAGTEVITGTAQFTTYAYNLTIN
ncbi:glycoside hydrolase family 12 protein [Suillus bovinus]|uniref:glycoside hydrolase family 12 protein n=1 Tax=Suillus bovinus TaxID=48563 RepID=UPI001B8772EF|nr:glycoside hydrolase family 12 protein [Suillus bovinus]KAG2147883.1 glycoside hydrolase family 12 protein [Suillus bovinus]